MLNYGHAPTYAYISDDGQNLCVLNWRCAAGAGEITVRIRRRWSASSACSNGSGSGGGCKPWKTPYPRGVWLHQVFDSARRL